MRDVCVQGDREGARACVCACVFIAFQLMLTYILFTPLPLACFEGIVYSSSISPFRSEVNKNVFLKGPDSQYFRLFRLYSPYCNHSTLLQQSGFMAIKAAIDNTQKINFIWQNRSRPDLLWMMSTLWVWTWKGLCFAYPCPWVPQDIQGRFSTLAFIFLGVSGH